MSDRIQAMTDEQLGTAVTMAAHHLAWPDTPDISGAVSRRIRTAEAPPRRIGSNLWLPSRRRTALVVVAAALLMLAGAALAARLVFELGAVTVEVLPGRPTAPPTNATGPEDLGRAVTLAEASRIAGFPASLPSALGPPDRTWVDHTRIGFGSGDVARRIALSWRPSTRLPVITGTDTGAVLMQFEGEWEVASKLLYSETNDYGEAIVDGLPAFWTSGEHELMLRSVDRPIRVLVTGNVLIWQRGDITFRLETALERTDAIALAESVEPAADPS